MTNSVDQIVQQIHDSPTRIVLAISGGGSRVIADLLEVPGASRTLLQAIVPYSAQAMIDFLGTRPDEFCSARTARAMAMKAFLLACKLGQSNINVAGLACSAGLITDRPRKGPHRIHVVLQTADITATWSLELLKGRRCRAEEERIAGQLLLSAVAESCGLTDRVSLDLLEGEKIEQSRAAAQPAWKNILLGNAEIAYQGKSLSANPAIFSGAFNPLHNGHRRMAQLGAELLNKPVAWEISLFNVDKPPLDYLEISRRLGQFSPEQPLFVTRAATYVEKARLFPGTTFLIGVDTLRRIAMDRYYHDDPEACRCSLEKIAQRGCRFLVFGRDLATGFVRLGDLDLPDVLRNICREVSANVFREDISSTSIRKTGAW
ncbi:MAG: CinA family protein [Thermoguttaceae bacterium]